MARRLSDSLLVTSELKYNHRPSPHSGRGNGSPRRFGYNVNRVRFTRPDGKRLYGGRVYGYGATGRLSAMSREVFEDVLRFEEEITTMSITITGVAGRSTQEMDQTIDGGTRQLLPPDNHGPANMRNDAQNNQSNNSTSKTNFKYYASEQQGREKEKKESDRQEQIAQDRKRTIVPQSDLDKETSENTEKTLATTSHKDNASDLKKSILNNGSYKSSSKTTSNAPLTPRTDFSDNSKKRYEVTIVDQRQANSSEDEDDEPFIHEYEYRHTVTANRAQFKTFDEMDDEEKIEYFRSELHMHPDQIREFTFHPKVNQPNVIHSTYTGVDTVNWSATDIKANRRPKSFRNNIYRKVNPVLPYQRKSYLLSKLQGSVYRHINEVYGSSPRNIREKQFYEKLAQVQLESIQRKYEMLAEEERRHLEAKYRQREQLKSLRKKFEDDAWRRFMTQYVTPKVMEVEYKSSEEYGLPNDINEEQLRSSHYAVNRNQYTLTPKRRAKANYKKYSNLFKFNTGPVYTSRGKPPKFEGIDTVDVDTEDESGQRVSKKQDVDDLMREANRIVNQPGDGMESEETPQSVHKSHNVPDNEGKSYPDNLSSHRSNVTDKNGSRSRKTRSRSVQHTQMPKSIKGLVERRQSLVAPTNRYKVSEFAAAKSDLLKTNEKLNKNKILKNKINKFPNKEKLMKPERESKIKSKSMSKNTHVDISILHVNQNIQIPPGIPAPVRNVSSSKPTTHENLEQTKNESEEIKARELNVYLDHMETQMAIETARDQNKHDQNQTVKMFPTVSETKSLPKVSAKSTDQKQTKQATSRLSRTNASTDMKSSSRRLSLESITATSDNKRNENTDIKQNFPELTEHVTVAGKRRNSIPSIQTQISNGGRQNFQENKTANVTTTTVIATMDDSLEDSHSSTIANAREIEQKDVSDNVTSTPTYGARTVNGLASVNTNATHKQNDTAKPNVHTSKSVNVSEIVTENTYTLGGKKNGDTKISNTISNKSSTHNSNDSLNKAPSQARTNVLNGSLESQKQKESLDNKAAKQRAKHVNQRKSRSRTPTTSDNDDIRMKRDEYEQQKHSSNRPTSRSTPREEGRKRSTSRERKSSIQNERKRSISNERDKSITGALHSRFPNIKQNENRKNSVQSSVPTKTTVSRRENIEEKVFTTEYTSNNNNGAEPWRDLVQKYLRQPSPKIGKTADRSLLEIKTDDEDDDEIDIFERAKRRYALDVNDDDDDDDGK